MSVPRISVVIPTLNSARFISDAIGSVLKQTVPAAEILLVDGGSSDNTAEVARRLGGPLQVLSQKSGGRPGARNAGLRRAIGDYIALLDSDDVWVPDKMAAQLAFFQKHPEIEMVFGDMALFQKADDPDEPEILDAEIHEYLRRNPATLERLLECLFTVNFVPTSSVMFRKSCMQTVGYMNECFSHCEDYEYWLRFAANARVGFLDRVLVRRRIHETNAMSDAYVQNCEATLLLLEQWRGRSGLSQDARRKLSWRTVLVQYNLSSHHLKSGRFEEARQQFRRLAAGDEKIQISLRLKILAKTLLAGWRCKSNGGHLRAKDKDGI